MIRYVLSAFFLAAATSAAADEPQILNVTATPGTNGWRFDVTLAHPDTGWDHYADGWRILDMDGNELALRVLTHPHVEEQPFTRSLGGVQIHEDVTRVHIQAHCLVDGWSGQAVALSLP